MHIVFAAKGRTPMIDPTWADDLHAYLGGIVRNLGAAAIAAGGTSDHVHLLAGLRSTHCVADLVREVKKGSSLWAAERNPQFQWQGGYGAFGIRAVDIPTVHGYIQRQEEHHRALSSADEMLAMLEEHGIEYDRQYFE